MGNYCEGMGGLGPEERLCCLAARFLSTLTDSLLTFPSRKTEPRLY